MLELIASDMDGTLLGGDLVIPKENREAIFHTYSLGIPFIICTGRNYIEAKKILMDAQINCPIIGLNGAVLFSREGEVEFELPLEDKDALDLIDYLESLGLYVEAMTSENVYSSSRDDRIHLLAMLISEMSQDMSEEEALTRATQSNEVNSIEYVPDLRELITKEGKHILKISVSDLRYKSLLAKARQYVDDNLKGIATTSSFKYNLEFSNSAVSKGTTLTEYCKNHNYHLDNVMAVGDNYNDISMLEAAGISFAMGNAEDEVKKHAQYVTDTNNNAGVAKAIQRALKLTHTPNAY